MSSAPKFSFTMFRFVGPQGQRTTEIVRDPSIADGMRSLVERNTKLIELAHERVTDWANSRGLIVSAQEPFPSTRHAGKVWLEYRFGSLVL